LTFKPAEKGLGKVLNDYQIETLKLVLRKGEEGIISKDAWQHVKTVISSLIGDFSDETNIALKSSKFNLTFRASMKHRSVEVSYRSNQDLIPIYVDWWLSDKKGRR
jgi:hypothetical protein